MSSKLPLKAGAEIIAEFIAIFIAIRVGSISGPLPGIMVFFTGSWLFYKASSYERLWDLIGMLKDPARAFLVYFSAASIYYGVSGHGINKLLLISLGAGTVGSALALLFDGYWNIGG